MALLTGNLTGTVGFSIKASETSPGSTSGVLNNTLTAQFQEVLNLGTASNQANLFVSQIPAAIAASGTLNLDLYDASTPLLDILGNTCAFRHVKQMIIWIVPGTGDVSGVTIGAAGSNPWLGPLGGTTPTFTIYPGGLPFCGGEPTVGLVVSSTHGQLLLTNNSSSVAAQLQIVVAGTTT